MAKKTDKQSAAALFAGMNSYSGNAKKTDSETEKEEGFPVSVKEEGIKTEEEVSASEVREEEMSNILYNILDERPSKNLKPAIAIAGSAAKNPRRYTIKKKPARTKNPRSFYLSDSLWENLQATAAENDISVSELAEQLLSSFYK